MSIRPPHTEASPDDDAQRSWRSPFRSLPARISFFVFAATLISSLAVTLISVRSIDGFLREKIDQKFPTILANTEQTLDLWFEQRVLELRVFSSSEILIENLGRMRHRNRAERERAERELRDYTSTVLEGFPQYRSLFLMSPDGRALLASGDAIELSSERLATLRDVTGIRLDAIFLAGTERLQIASSPVRDGNGEIVGTLHALLRVDALDGLLTSQYLGSGGRVFLVDDSGTCLVGERPGEACYARPLPESQAPARISDYDDAGGRRVVGSAIRLARQDWTLVVEEPYSEAFAPVVSSLSRVLAINLAIVGALCAFAFRIAGSIVRPIDQLSLAARRIAEGERNVELPEHPSQDEVGLLTRAFEQMTRRLAENALEIEQSHQRVAEANEQLREQNDELQSVNQILEQLSITDGLTKLHNHRYFQDTLLRETKRSDRTGDPLMLILVDIDHFKEWNDRLGHAGGDEILRRIAELMVGVVRDTDHLARYGGEEFALLAPDTDLDGATQLAEKVRSTISETRFLMEPPSESRNVTVSVGVAPYRGDRAKLFNDADRALYRAKSGGRDCVVVDDDDTAEGEESPADTAERERRER